MTVVTFRARPPTNGAQSCDWISTVCGRTFDDHADNERISPNAA
jgi:hypothetical protein